MTSLYQFVRLVPKIESIVLNTPSNRLTRPFPKDSKPPIISPDKKFVTPEKTSASELTSPATISRAGPSICSSTSASDDITGIIGDNAPSIRPITADNNFPTAEITAPSGSASSATSSRIGVSSSITTSSIGNNASITSISGGRSVSTILIIGGNSLSKSLINVGTSF